MTRLLAAAAIFVLLHLVLSSLPVRTPLERRLGKGFRVLYALVMVGSFGWLLVAYRSAPYITVWIPPLWTRWVPNLIMPFALLLVVLGGSTKSPTSVGQDKLLSQPPQGVLRVTRHPGLWGIALWGLSHLTANGDARNIVLMSAMVLLSFVGMVHIDARRRARSPQAWQQFARQTSLLPFAAVATGRTRLDLKEIGWVRPLIALVLWGALLHGHRWLTGVSPLPM